jgi:hypothetical protein
MLDAKERRTRLEDMLGLVQQNRTRLTKERLSPAEAGPTPAEMATPVAEMATPVAEPATIQETVSMRRPDKPKAVAKKAKAATEKPKAVAVKPKAVAVESPVPEEVRQFESTPATSGSVAVASGQLKREWTVAAVLERAWKLGSSQ